LFTFSPQIAAHTGLSFAPAAAPAAVHLDASPTLLFTSSAATLSVALASEGSHVAAAPVASVFSGSSNDSGGAGSFVLSELPFTHDMSLDEAPVYTASGDTPWLLVADFSGDDWFYA
jgi:hypothetical protein